MSAIPGLKKKLRSVRAAGKLSKAMKTVSAAKYSKLSALFRYYSAYAEQYRSLCGKAENINDKAETVVVLGSNRGFCGGFNNELLQLLKSSVLSEGMPAHLIVCGEKLGRVLAENGITAEKVIVFGDIPSFGESGGLYEELLSIANGRRNYPVTLVRPVYKNTMTQIPQSETLLLEPAGSLSGAEDALMFPDKATVERVIAEKGLRALLYGAVLETALGAQAATLMTMRSAYDTATEYSAELESEIHRQRQRDVTADVIETSSNGGNKEKGDETNA